MGCYKITFQIRVIYNSVLNGVSRLEAPSNPDEYVGVYFLLVSNTGFQASFRRITTYFLLYLIDVTLCVFSAIYD